jgi:hypothetical protein
MNEEQLEEFAAWCEIAMRCEGSLHGVFLRGGGTGICSLIYDVTGGRETRLRGALHRRMSDNGPPINAVSLPWWWPTTRAGWNARARFSWRMAAQVEEESQ